VTGAVAGGPAGGADAEVHDPPAPSDGPRPTAPGLVRREARAFVELLALSGFALAQPIYDIFGRAPDQFIFRGAEQRDIVAFAFVVLLAPPLVLWVVEVLVGLVSASARRWLHVGLLGVLVTAFAIQVLRPISDGPLLLLLGAAVGVLAGLVYVRTTAARIWLAFAAVAPPAFCALFLLTSQTAQLLGDPAAAGEVRIRRPGPVAMIVFDELPLAALVGRDGKIDEQLYPNFAALADGSHWFRNTTGVSNFTWSAVPSLLTATQPRDDTVPTAVSHPRSLFTLLGGSMDLEVTESITRVCPTDLCEVDTPDDGGLRGVLTDARDVMEHRLAPNPGDDDPVAGLVDDGQAQEDEATTGPAASSERIEGFIEGLDDPGATLHYLHVLLPHVPYRYLPDGTRYEGPDPDLGRSGDVWQDQPWLVDLGRQRMALQLGYADAVLGRALDRLRSSGTYDDATVVVVADHGIAFQAGEGIRGLELDAPFSPSAAAEVMWVPFFVKEPGQTEGEVSDANLTTVDVLPTIADVLDIDIPWDIDGRSAFAPPRTDTTKRMYQADYRASGVLAGRPYEIDAEEGWQHVLDRSIEELLPRGPASADERWYAVGPHPELVGVRASDASARLTEVRSELDDASRMDDVDTGSGEVPALVRATVPGASPGDPIAIAVDGRIAAVVPAYADGDAVRIAAIVPAETFRDGANEYRAYAVG
jgi:hypothetical protein